MNVVNVVVLHYVTNDYYPQGEKGDKGEKGFMVRLSFHLYSF